MAGSPFVWRMRSARYREPARTLSTADVGSRRGRARLACTHAHVPGRICITPRAFAPDSIALLKPLSCQAIAVARDPGAPCWAAIEPICDALRRPELATGGAAGTTVRAGAGVDAVTGEPVGSLITVPASSGLLGSRPFMNAICDIGTRLRAASALSVSPGRTS